MSARTWGLPIVALIVFSFVDSQLAHAATWVREFPADVPIDISSLAAQDEGGSVIAGTMVVDSFLFAHVVRLNSDGFPVWAQRYKIAPNQGLTAAATSPSGHIYVGGFFNSPLGALLLKLNGADGSVVWQRAIAGETTVTSLAPTADGGVAVVCPVRDDGILSTGKPVVLKFTEAGELEWQRILEREPAARRQAIAETANGELVIAAEYETGPLVADIDVLRLRNDGSLVWFRRISGMVELGAIHADHGNGTMLLANRGFRVVLIQLGESGAVEGSSAYNFPTLTSNITGIRPMGLARVPNGDWVFTVAEGFDRGMVARVRKDFSVVWHSVVHAGFGFAMEVVQSGEDFLIAGELEPPFGRDGVIRLNGQGRVEADACDILEPVDLAAISTEINALEADENVGESELDLLNRQLDVDEGTAQSNFACRETPARPRPCDIDVVEPPLEVCFDWGEIINPRPLLGGMDPGSLVDWNCNDEPQCPRCLVSMDDGRTFEENPGWRAEIYAALGEIVTVRKSVGAGKAAGLERLRDGLAKAPRGRFYSEEVRRHTIEYLNALPAQNIDLSSVWQVPGFRCEISTALNRLDLDLVGPQALQGKKSAAGIVQFGDFVTLQSAPAEDSPDYGVTLSPALPGRLDHHRLGWPTVAFTISKGTTQTRGPNSLKSPLSVTVRYNGLRFADEPKSLRLLQWNGNGWSDITQAIDTRLGRITGVTHSLGTFVVATAIDTNSRLKAKLPR